MQTIHRLSLMSQLFGPSAQQNRGGMQIKECTEMTLGLDGMGKWTFVSLLSTHALYHWHVDLSFDMHIFNGLNFLL